MDKIILFENEKTNILFSTKYEKEYELQELVKNNPAIVEISSIFSAPLLIIGRETLRIDVLGITLSGIPVIIECKRKENPDMRYLIAQLFEYGAVLRGKSFEDLDSYAKDYFNSEKCKEAQYRDKSLLESLTMLKEEHPEFDDTTDENIQETVYNNLKEGNFYLLVVADEIKDVASATIDFLNSKLEGIHIEIVEIKKYELNNTLVFVPLHKNPADKIKKRISKGIGKTTLEEMKNKGTINQSENISQMIQLWENHEDCSIEMGTSGLSMRYKDISVFWLFINSFKIASPLKKQLEEKGIPNAIYDNIEELTAKQWKKKSIDTEKINIPEYKNVIESVYKLLKGVMG
jgi:hypothetical protein